MTTTGSDTEGDDEGDRGDGLGCRSGRDDAGEVVVQVHPSGIVPTELTRPSTWTDHLERDRTPSRSAASSSNPRPGAPEPAARHSAIRLVDAAAGNRGGLGEATGTEG